ncbi:enoyl-CoA hydratase/isomerase family protein [Pueribacillus theae]|uniref:enoyl-CoA hydratase/isomerase family protein n=1 Tax=Pueribacillus theae TaxID=2171751 RepID=UPI0019813A42|nr:enoyl-CoA hydratase/isomerase family protein [Pueribacillus theae]
MKFQQIIAERNNNIGIITLNRPEKKNAISIQMREEISQCLNNWQTKEEIMAVIITGSSSVFSTGFDLSDFNHPEQFDRLLHSSSRYHKDIWYFPKPTIAAINGLALGGGFDLATFCDFRICTPSALFGHPEVKFGAPPLITPLRWIVGEGIARELCLTGRTIDAKEAFRIGLANEILKEKNILDRAIELVNTILEAPNDTLLYLKSFMTGNKKKEFETCFFIEHDEAFRKLLLPKAKEGFKKT